jgi:hypothetical protein
MERNWRFGKNQLSNPTPKRLALALNVYSAIATTVTGWMPTVAFIPNSVQNVITPILALTILMVQAIKPFFGKSDSSQSYSAPGDEELSKK